MTCIEEGGMSEGKATAAQEVASARPPVPAPRGTTFLISAYFVILSLMWAAMLLGLISR
jgi:hypothetical protein